MRASDKWLSVSQDVPFLWFTDIRSRRCVVNDDDVSQFTIGNCWRQVGSLPTDDQADIEPSDADDDTPLADLRSMIHLPEPDCDLTPDQCIDIEGEDITCQELDDDTILQLVTRADTTEEPTTDPVGPADVETEPEPVSAKQAKASIDVLIQYLEQHGCVSALDTAWDIRKCIQQQSQFTQSCVTDFFQTTGSG